jgi:hypothetical protein
MKRISIAVVFLTAALLTAKPAFADQAAWVTREEAVRALRILAEYESIKHFCAPCGDTKVTTEPIRNIGMYRIKDEDYWEIKVNGKGVDLAYVYFPKKRDKWVNAAIEADIDVSDVPKELSRTLLGY